MELKKVVFSPLSMSKSTPLSSMTWVWLMMIGSERTVERQRVMTEMQVLMTARRQGV